MVFSYGSPSRLIHPCYEIYLTFHCKFSISSILAFYWLPAPCLDAPYLLCANLSKRVVYIHDLHLPIGQPLGLLLYSVLPRAVVLDELLSACLIRIHSWNPHQLKRQTHPYPHSTALHWQKGELNQVMLFGPHLFVPSPALDSVSCIEAPVDFSPSSPR